MHQIRSQRLTSDLKETTSLTFEKLDTGSKEGVKVSDTLKAGSEGAARGWPPCSSQCARRLQCCCARRRGAGAVVWRARSRHTMEGHGGGGPGVVPRGGGEESRDHER